jgi:hypothetical protein
VQQGQMRFAFQRYPDTHEKFAVLAFENGCHVFIEKPLGRFGGRSMSVLLPQQRKRVKNL